MSAAALFVITVTTASIPIMMPVLYAAVGEIFAEQAGIMNIGIEGMMLMGAWATFMGVVETHSVVLGLLTGMAAGCALGILLAVFYVTLGTDQIVTGVLANILVLGLTSLVYSRLFGQDQPSFALLPTVALPALAHIAGLGPILFQHDVLVYLGWAMVPVAFFVLRRTWVGLSLQAVGEHPRAADTAGINIAAVRYAGTTIAGVMAALGGASLVLSQLGGFSENATAGRGFIALAVVVLGRWNPFGVLAGAFLFGAAEALQLRLQAIGLGIPHDLLLMLPYLLTIIVLVGFVGGARYPTATGTPYRRQ